jgi:uncharacterized protein (DUF427 family)
MKKPGPDHPISIQPTLDRVTVRFGGQVIAESIRALTLREANYPPVQYIPRADVRMDLLVPTDRSTHCPYKGEASYYSIRLKQAAGGDNRAEHAVWCYRTPFPAVAEIADHLAFYPERVEAIEITKIGD